MDGGWMDGCLATSIVRMMPTAEMSSGQKAQGFIQLSRIGCILMQVSLK
jgi:hypothetical protein